MTITGKGIYKGSVTKQFTILKEEVKPVIKKDDKKSDVVKTGDTTSLLMFASMTLISLFSIIFLRKKYKNNI